MFDKPGLFYSNKPSRVLFNDQWLFDSEKIKKLKSHKLIVLDFSSEHYGIDGIDHVYHELTEHGLNFILLTHEIQDHLRLPRLLFYSFWYYYSIKNFNPPQSYNRKYAWSCLNGNPRVHRIYNFYLAKSKSYFDQSIFSMHDLDASWCSRRDDFILPPEVTQFWENIRNTLPNRVTVINTDTLIANNIQGLDIDIPAFTECYCHMVSESTVLPRVFITEKTWKPVAAQQLFLMLGNPKTINALRSLGVDVYDDVIDHSYDNELNWQKRMEMAYQSLEAVISTDLEQLYHQTEARRKKNFDLFQSGKFGLEYKQDLINAIDIYLK